MRARSCRRRVDGGFFQSEATADRREKERTRPEKKSRENNLFRKDRYGPKFPVLISLCAPGVVLLEPRRRKLDLHEPTGVDAQPRRSGRCLVSGPTGVRDGQVQGRRSRIPGFLSRRNGSGQQQQLQVPAPATQSMLLRLRIRRFREVVSNSGPRHRARVGRRLPRRESSLQIRVGRFQ